jgi:hypothetical protein
MMLAIAHHHPPRRLRLLRRHYHTIGAHRRAVPGAGRPAAVGIAPRCRGRHFRGLLFLSVGRVDSGEFKGDGALDDLRVRTEAMLDRYVSLARSLGLPAQGRMATGPM